MKNEIRTPGERFSNETFTPVYVPYNHNTGRLLKELAALNPKTLATMHGSPFFGDCPKALPDLDG